MFITKKYGLVSSRSEYIMLAHADRICRERHKAENEVVRYKMERPNVIYFDEMRCGDMP